MMFFIFISNAETFVSVAAIETLFLFCRSHIVPFSRQLVVLKEMEIINLVRNMRQ